MQQHERKCGSKNKWCPHSQARWTSSWKDLVGQGCSQSLYSRCFDDTGTWEYLENRNWGPPQATDDLTITIHKVEKRRAERCLVCGNHQSRARRTCILCRQRRALPSCEPELCWMQFDGKMGACRWCFWGALQSVYQEPAASIIMSWLGWEYGAVKRRRTKPPGDECFRKALGVVTECTV